MLESWQGFFFVLLLITVPLALIDKYEKKAREEHERKR